MWFSFIYLNFEDILSNCEIPSFVWCIFMAHFQCICVQQNFLLMKIKSLLPSRGKILNKMMFNAFKERDTILKENIFVIFCLLTIGRFLLSIEPLELYFSFVNGKMERLLKRCHFLCHLKWFVIGPLFKFIVEVNLVYLVMWSKPLLILLLLVCL